LWLAAKPNGWLFMPKGTKPRTEGMFATLAGISPIGTG